MLWSAAMMAVLPVLAADHRPGRQGSERTERAERSDLERAIAQVRRETGGRVLSAETVVVGRGEVHRIRVLTPDGRVRTVELRAEPAGRR
jgi:hypothetical protein